MGQDSLDENDESAYWNDRYRLRKQESSVYTSSSKPESGVPKILEGCQDTILTTGATRDGLGFISFSRFPYLSFPLCLGLKNVLLKQLCFYFKSFFHFQFS